MTKVSDAILVSSVEILDKVLDIIKERDIIELTLNEKGISVKTYRKNNDNNKN